MHLLFFALLPAALLADPADYEWANLSKLTTGKLLAAVALVIAWVLDLIIAHTTWALIAGWPEKGEWTVSDTLKRLASPVNADHVDYKFYVEVVNKLNRVNPTKPHIEVESHG